MQKPNPPQQPDWSEYTVQNPDELVRNMLLLWSEGGRAMAGLMERADSKGGSYSAATEMTEATRIMSEVAQQWMSDPTKAMEAQGELVKGYMDVWTSALQRMSGQHAEPVAEPESGDGRFRDPDWSANPYFEFWKQSYLVTTQWAEKALSETSGLDERTKQRAEYYLRQMASALSPSNFPATNPEVLRETLKTNGANLVKGMENLLADMAKSDDLLKISQTDTTAFKVGENLAVTPGKVVYQNDLLQLIQYTPTTDKVYATPLLIIPPWINKFYILDLTQPKSFIKWAVDQGFTVFVVSWVNPDERLKHKTFEDYMKEGVLTAADAVQRETGQRQMNVIGYCVGGTLLATTLAHNAAKGHDPFASATFFAAQKDFTKAGDLLLFIDDAQLKALEEMMAEKGYLDGSRMATVFNMLRPRDLIWPYIVNNYMLGKKPFPFDLLYWNQDSTRMPAANHNYYLREFYHENKLAKGLLSIGGIRLDLKKVTIPIYELAAREDHIAPAKSVFIGSKLFGGPVEYVLSGSGHIAGVINPPPADGKRPKYQYWTNSRGGDTLEEWLAHAKETPGSWWPHWGKWLAERSGSKVPARIPGAKLGVIEDAPGSYVRAKA
ncbi:MAG: class I poly(R)-hydroxyalkanoic acid synthase [Hyphomicrobiaceae bacterium]